MSVATVGTTESAAAILSDTASFTCWGKRSRGISAITKTMTKSSKNMSVFLLTAAKVVQIKRNTKRILSFLELNDVY